jgi:hypothetical protein
VARLLTLLPRQAWQSAKSRVFAEPDGPTGEAAVEQRLLALLLVGDRGTRGIVETRGLPRGPHARLPNVSRRRIAILLVRCAHKPLPASSRTLEPIDGQRES